MTRILAHVRSASIAALCALAVAGIALGAPADAAGTAPAAAVDDAPQFVLMPSAESPFVTFRIWIRAGSANDPAGKEGLAQLTGSLIGRAGTRNNRYDAILQQLFPMAGGYSVSVDREMTVLEGTVHRDHRDAFYGLIRDALTAPAFDPGDFERLRTDQANYLENNLRFGDDEELAKAVLHGAAFEGTSYAHPEAGFVQSVKALTLDDVKAFYDTWYRRGNIVVGLAGGFGDDLVERLTADLAALPAGAAPAFTPPAPARTARGLRVFIVEKETRATAISFGHPIAVTRADDDFYHLMIPNSWLGEHRTSSSHLYQVMREARGLNYGDYSYLEWFAGSEWHEIPPPNHARHRQMFEVWIRPVMNANRHFALRQAMREVAMLVRDGMTPETLQLTQNYLLNFSLHYATTESARLGYAVDDRFYGLPESHLARIRERVGAATLEEVHAALRRNIDPGNLDIVFVTNDAAGLKAALVGDLPSPIRYDAPTPESILAEDRVIQAYPLKIAPEAIRVIPVEEVFESPAGS
jgi:zinc protease